ncbi:hypothetical protein SAMN05443637_114155 [Pseudonocardia thermophila]|uniref:Outer membrane lipoprotein-sorting protein n=1 Tax=Pseudonocardia thermophila TaxID=1848 RepID=A0A1M6WFW8_PSETH|nr:hypothetical protein [Pseudonocardia thermophila]SHK92682.1 hypothetical protein SAMN05443637_114155 [Pseudonocardia thermophila]
MRRFGRPVAAAVAVAGLVGLGLLAVPAGAGAQPELPPVTPEELVRSVLEAKPGPFAGTVEAENALGLPALPGLPAAAADGTSTARVWAGDERQGRVQLPTSDSERTFVTDGATFWTWDSDTREVTTGSRAAQPGRGPAVDPATAAGELIDRLGGSSTLAVDGTAEVAGRPAYELVLAPQPTERTLLREIRIAVDAEKRMPLRLVVLANGSPDPALRIGFTDVAFGPQDPALFTFTPPPGSTVRTAPAERPGNRRGAPNAQVRTVGDGWDAVHVAERGAQAPGNIPDLDRIGTRVSGPWGSGRLITSVVGSVLVTDDGRIAAGAVPEQVLTEALTR